MPSFDLIPTLSVYSSENKEVEVTQEDDVRTNPIDEPVKKSLSQRLGAESEDSMGSDFEEVDSLGFPTPRASAETVRVQSPRVAQDGHSPTSEKSDSSHFLKENGEGVEHFSIGRSKMFIFSHLSPDLFKRRAAPEEEGLATASRASSAKTFKDPEASPTVSRAKACLPPICSKTTGTLSLNHPAALFSQGSRDLPTVVLVPKRPTTSRPASSFMPLPPLMGR